MIYLNEWLEGMTGLSAGLQEQIFGSLLIIVLLWLIRRLVIRIVWKRTDNIEVRYRWQKSATYVLMALGFLLVGRVWFSGVQSLATYLGLLSAGLAIALQDIVASLAGWIFILSRRPFTLGDRVQIGEFIGDVIDIRVFKFTLLEVGNWVDADDNTGRIIHLPNSAVLSDNIANYNKGFRFIWNEVPVLVTFESDWQKAKKILQIIADKDSVHLSKRAERRIKEASKRYMIHYETLDPTVYTSVKDSGVMLSIRYLVEPRNRRDTEQTIWEDILLEFAKCDDIDFAYPSQRFYLNMLEGKPDAKAPVPTFWNGELPKAKAK